MFRNLRRHKRRTVASPSLQVQEQFLSRLITLIRESIDISPLQLLVYSGTEFRIVKVVSSYQTIYSRLKDILVWSLSLIIPTSNFPLNHSADFRLRCNDYGYNCSNFNVDYGRRYVKFLFQILRSKNPEEMPMHYTYTCIYLYI